MFKNPKMNTEGVPEITCNDLHQALETPNEALKMIDVRRADEFTGELGHIEGTLLSTLELSFGQDIAQWPKDKVYVFICRSGMRSSRATAHALSLGFKQVYNLEGGMLAWNEKQLPIKK
jgi:rhodanese-related sulfurtransferase